MQPFFVSGIRLIPYATNRNHKRINTIPRPCRSGLRLTSDVLFHPHYATEARIVHLSKKGENGNQKIVPEVFPPALYKIRNPAHKTVRRGSTPPSGRPSR